eukprot:3188215-Amphidinium_carterae.1
MTSHFVNVLLKKDYDWYGTWNGASAVKIKNYVGPHLPQGKHACIARRHCQIVGLGLALPGMSTRLSSRT